MMGSVVSLGSINVDRIWRVSARELAAFEEYDWFPERDETVSVAGVPEELTAGYDHVRHGGKGANQAVAAASGGAQTAMFGNVGPDSEEFSVRDSLTDSGVTADRVRTATAPTGTADVFVGPCADSRIVVHPGANGALDWDYIERQYDTIREADCLLLQNEIPVAPVAALLSELTAEPERPTVILDPAPAAGAARLVGCDAVDYLTPNEREYEMLRPHLDDFDGMLVRTSGGDGIVVEGDRRFTVEPPGVTPVDTTGAGDTMNGFVAARLANGASLREAIETGAVAGALSTQAESARAGIPTLEEVRSVQRSDTVRSQS